MPQLDVERRENQSKVVIFSQAGVRNISDLVKERAKDDSSKQRSGKVRQKTESRNEKEMFTKRRKGMLSEGGQGFPAR